MKFFQIAMAIICLVTLEACLASTPSAPVQKTARFTYIEVSATEAIDQASAIVIGTVDHLSPTRWNQDSGEYWEDPSTGMANLPYYEIAITVEQSIRGNYEPNEKVIVTVLGNSPTDLPLLADEERPVFAEEYFIQSGERVLLLLETRAMAWRTGPQDRLMVVGGPQGKYLLTQDGQALNAADPGRNTTLEKLLNQISAAGQ